MNVKKNYIKISYILSKKTSLWNKSTYFCCCVNCLVIFITTLWMFMMISLCSFISFFNNKRSSWIISGTVLGTGGGAAWSTRRLFFFFALDWDFFFFFEDLGTSTSECLNHKFSIDETWHPWRVRIRIFVTKFPFMDFLRINKLPLSVGNFQFSRHVSDTHATDE